MASAPTNSYEAYPLTGKLLKTFFGVYPIGPLASMPIARLLRHLGTRLPCAFVLRYHSISDNAYSLPGLAVRASAFEAQLRWLASHFQPVTLDGLCSGTSGSGVRFAITFDDGYRDNYSTALPLLKAVNVPATVFVTTGCVGSEMRIWVDELVEHARALRWKFGRLRREFLQAMRATPQERTAFISGLRLASGVTGKEIAASIPMLGWDDLHQLEQSGIVRVGAHTVTHPRLSQLTPADVTREALGSKHALEAELGSTVSSFAIPFGATADFTPSTVESLRQSGFDIICSSLSGVVRPSSDRLVVPRVGVYADDTVASILTKVLWALSSRV